MFYYKGKYAEKKLLESSPFGVLKKEKKNVTRTAGIV